MKIKYIYIAFLFMALILTDAYSQGQGRGGGGRYGKGQREKLESAKMAFITERVALSPEQAEKFWPVYNDFNAKKWSIREEMARNRQQLNGGLDEKQALNLIRQHQANKQKEVDLEKEYTDKLLNILSAKQTALLLSAEVEFRKVLLEKLRENRE